MRRASGNLIFFVLLLSSSLALEGLYTIEACWIIVGHIFFFGYGPSGLAYSKNIVCSQSYQIVTLFFCSSVETNSVRSSVFGFLEMFGKFGVRFLRPNSMFGSRFGRTFPNS